MARNKYRIALIVDNLTTVYSYELYVSVNKYCKENNYELLVFQIGKLHSISSPFDYQSAAISSLINSNSIDGIVFCAGAQLHHISNSELTSYIKSFNPIPVVCVTAEMKEFPSIYVNPEPAYRKIIDNLIYEQGCKRFAILGVRSSSAEMKLRRNIIRNILDEHGIAKENCSYFRMSFDYLNVKQDLETYALSNDGNINYDAIICLTDEIAYAACDFLKEKGFNIPNNYLLTGFDNSEQTEFSIPSITTVDQNIDLQAKKAIEMMTSIFDDEYFEKNVEITAIPVFRDSTAKIPYSAALQNDPDVIIHTDISKIMESRNAIADIFMQRSKVWKITQYYTETSFNMTVEQLKTRLNSDLRKFDLKAAAVVLYEAPIEMPIPFDYFNLPHRASVFCAFDEDSGYDSEILPERIKFDPNDRILPDGILNFDGNGTVCIALYHNTLQYGYFVFRSPEDFDYLICDFIIKIVASLISSVMSFAQVNIEQTNFRKKYRELDMVANTDELTGLYNRRGLFDFGQTTLKFAKAMNQTGLLIFGDMDGLKKINDNYGHESGDRAIIAESIILRCNFRSNDIIARIGGDEFVIISPGLTEEAFARIEKEIVKDCELWTETNKSPFNLSISLGYVKFPSEKVGYQITPLLSEADANLYVTKRNRNSK